MKIVNKGRGAYFFVAVFGITLFFVMFFIAPNTVFAPWEETAQWAVSTDTPPHSISDIGKPTSPDADTLVDDIPLTEPESSRVLFVGDIMLARAVEWSIKEEGAGYPFLLWDAGLFADADAVIGNFEGTIRDAEHIEQTNVMAFDTLPEYVTPLAGAGFTHLSLANNHADDFGQATTDFMRSTITDVGITPFGDPFVSESFIARIDGGIPVSLVGFHAFNEETASIVETIRTEDAAGNFVIVYPHWGVEYNHEPSISQTAAAQIWIDAGADLIIGAHPHVVQTAEIINGVPVIYSLGNFLFDQDFSRATQIGAVADVTLSSSEILITFSPVSILHRQMFVDHELDETLRSWLGIDSLTWTIYRQKTQTP
ncbi:MAG: CapA family protein [Patescibacteria group bacterium]